MHERRFAINVLVTDYIDVLASTQMGTDGCPNDEVPIEKGSLEKIEVFEYGRNNIAKGIYTFKGTEAEELLERIEALIEEEKRLMAERYELDGF